MKEHKILVIDDEQNIINALRRVLRKEEYQIIFANSGEEGLAILENERISLVLSDQKLPGIQGTELLKMVKEKYPNTVRMLLTGCVDISIAQEAINKGQIFKFIIKPWDNEDLRATIKLGIENYKLKLENIRLLKQIQEQNVELMNFNKTLEEQVANRTKELRDAYGKMNKTFLDTIQSLALAIEAKDPYTKGHSERVSIFSVELAKKLRLSHKDEWNINVAGILHDIGKIGIDEAILNKPGKLTPEEYEKVKKHPIISLKILEPIEFLDEIKPLILHHHEWYDGNGYPESISGNNIPLGSRILAVADTVEAMTSNRAYRKALDVDIVINELKHFSGTQFDPTLANAFIQMLEQEGLAFFEKKRKLKDFQLTKLN
jgi:response regulator RpfG family c-di-GMP phosphodiesterase